MAVSCTRSWKVTGEVIDEATGCKGVLSGTVVFADTEPPAPPGAFLAVNPLTVPAGLSAGLAWTTVNATTATLDGVSVPLTGSKQVSPPATTTYTLVATGPLGSATASAVLTVTPVVPPTPGFSKRFDFLPSTAPLPAGFLRVSEIPGGSYTAQQGYGFTRWWYLSEAVGPFVRTRNTSLPEVYRDVASSEELAFRIDCPPGRYTLRVYWGDTVGHDDVIVRVNAGPAANVTDRKPPWDSPPKGVVVDRVSTRAGEYFTRSYDLDAPNGFVELHWLDARYAEGARCRDFYGAACGIDLWSAGTTPPPVPPPPQASFPPDPPIPAAPTNRLVFGGNGQRPVPPGATYVGWNCDYVPGGRSFGWWGNSVMDDLDRGAGAPQ